MISSNEQDLLKGARSLDLDVLGAIYDRYSPGIFRYAMHLLGDENMAEDCVADTFLRFLKVLKNSQGPEDHLQAYLYRIAHNWITDSYRRSPPVPYELDEEYSADMRFQPEHEVETNIRKQRVRLALRSLTPDQRQVIILRFIEGWENSEVASALGKPLGAVKALQHRALDSLKEMLLPEEKARSDE
jgi:RNA polymerase sigma-70 factor (ECF subfamily)